MQNWGKSKSWNTYLMQTYQSQFLTKFKRNDGCVVPYMNIKVCCIMIIAWFNLHQLFKFLYYLTFWTGLNNQNGLNDWIGLKRLNDWKGLHDWNDKNCFNSLSCFNEIYDLHDLNLKYKMHPLFWWHLLFCSSILWCPHFVTVSKFL